MLGCCPKFENNINLPVLKHVLVFNCFMPICVALKFPYYVFQKVPFLEDFIIGDVNLNVCSTQSL